MFGCVGGQVCSAVSNVLCSCGGQVYSGVSVDVFVCVGGHVCSGVSMGRCTQVCRWTGVLLGRCVSRQCAHCSGLSLDRCVDGQVSGQVCCVLQVTSSV